MSLNLTALLWTGSAGNFKIVTSAEVMLFFLKKVSYYFFFIHSTGTFIGLILAPIELKWPNLMGGTGSG